MSEAAGPAAEAPRRLHPISPIFELIGAARQLVLPLIAALASGQWWFVAPTALVTVGRCVSWLRFTYQLDGDVVRIKEGLFVRKQRAVALDRIQQVDVVSKLRHRIFGVVGLHVDTASGASGAELKLEVVTVAEAARLRGLFDQSTRRIVAGSAPAEPAEASLPVRTVAKVSPAQLALAGMTGAQTLLILSLVFSMQELLDFVDVGRVRRLIPEGAESEPLAVGAAVITLAIIWLALAALTLVVTHYNYTLTTSGDQLRVTRGLLDRREVGVTLARVQALRIEQTFVRRILGFVAVRAQTAAVPGQSVSKIVIPFVAMRDVERVVGQLMPDVPAWPALHGAPRSAFWLGFARRVPPTALVCLAIAWFVRPWGALALLAIPGAVLAASLHWTALGHAVAGDTIWARRGGLFRETVIVPAAKAQSARSSASPLQRRVGLATLRIDVAGRGSTPIVQDASMVHIERIVAMVPHVAARDERATRPVRASGD